MILSKKFAFIGGDLRQLRVIRSLHQEGHLIRTYGLENAEDLKGEKSPSLTHCLDEAEIVVLPLPYTTDGETVRTPFSSQTIDINSLLSTMKQNQLLLVGKADTSLFRLAKQYKIFLIDYGNREELAIRNTIPTVEGALQIAMTETPFTIHGSRCLVLGYGRIGKLLSRSLKNLGAIVTVSARKVSDLAWIRSEGFSPTDYTSLLQKLPSFDLVFNTVPAMILDQEHLLALSDHALIIDLASNPGGVDFDAASAMGRRVIHALSLPGKVAPITAGDMIKDIICNILEEQEVNDT